MAKQPNRKKKAEKSSRLGHDPFASLDSETEENKTIEIDRIEPEPQTEEAITNDEQANLLLPSNFTIAAVEEVHGKMASIFEENNTTISVDPKEIESIDTAAIQLLYAFTEKIMTSGKSIHWLSHSEKIENASNILGIKIPD